ncbi:MAG: hypothetical protein C7B45_10070 [Sulfobacillus acidophilus]|uniref:Uncharacterized protein n=1 Tax=Sulfobacillus acidophilus TaxID=53633 RepID=A0A2T2WHE0_9FIRM|nr:MAG: hypothetical protein C7B45_10070 [Sulfobacillus acidophilus]
MTLDAQQEFHVLAQQRRGDPIVLIGSVWAPTPGLAAFYAATTYDEQRWFSLVIVDSGAEIPVIVDQHNIVMREA